MMMSQTLGQSGPQPVEPFPELGDLENEVAMVCDISAATHLDTGLFLVEVSVVPLPKCVSGHEFLCTLTNIL